MACEKCWGDAYLRMLSDPSKSQGEHYQDLLAERLNEPCGPEWETENWLKAEPLPREEPGK